MSERLAEWAAALADAPLWQAVLIALATLVLEDPTTVVAGLLVADGKMSFTVALLGLWAGIAFGDAALYGAGRAFGPAVERRGWIGPRRLERSRGWFRDNLVLAVLVSRFVPGMRLPTYVAAGMLRAPFVRFLAVAVGATLAWTLLLLTAVQWIGREIFPLLGRARWPLAIGALAALLLLQRSGTRRGRKRVASRFEFWPPWLFYLPVAPYYAWLSVRYGGWLIPTCANPAIRAGGLLGESKRSILALVPPEFSGSVARTALVPASTGSRDVRLESARRAMRGVGLDFPVVAKPDVGQRGAGIRPLDDVRDLAEYLDAFPREADLILQERVEPDPRARQRPEGEFPFVEAGVFWWRLPGAERGEVPSLTLKQLPSVVGDGTRTLRELIERDPRASRLKSIYFAKAGAPLDEPVREGVRIPLVFAGNHCQGAIFRDGRDYLHAPFADRIDALARAMPGFAFGRFDVRFDSFDAFLSGRFKIIEINGVGGEMTHIWDPSAKLGESYLTLFRQWRNAFRIGRHAADDGATPITAREFFSEWRRYRRLEARYPSSR